MAVPASDAVSIVPLILNHRLRNGLCNGLRNGLRFLLDDHGCSNFDRLRRENQPKTLDIHNLVKVLGEFPENAIAALLHDDHIRTESLHVWDGLHRKSSGNIHDNIAGLATPCTNLMTGAQLVDCLGNRIDKGNLHYYFLWTFLIMAFGRLDGTNLFSSFSSRRFKVK